MATAPLEALRRGSASAAPAHDEGQRGHRERCACEIARRRRGRRAAGASSALRLGRRRGRGLHVALLRLGRRARAALPHRPFVSRGRRLRRRRCDRALRTGFSNASRGVVGLGASRRAALTGVERADLVGGATDRSKRSTRGRAVRGRERGVLVGEVLLEGREVVLRSLRERVGRRQQRRCDERQSGQGRRAHRDRSIASFSSSRHGRTKKGSNAGPPTPPKPMETRVTT